MKPGSYVVVSPGTGSDVWRGSTLAYLVMVDGAEAVIRRLRGGYAGKRAVGSAHPPVLMKPVRVAAARLVREATPREVSLHMVENQLPKPFGPPVAA